MTKAVVQWRYSKSALTSAAGLSFSRSASLYGHTQHDVGMHSSQNGRPY